MNTNLLERLIANGGGSPAPAQEPVVTSKPTRTTRRKIDPVTKEPKNLSQQERIDALMCPYGCSDKVFKNKLGLGGHVRIKHGNVELGAEIQKGNTAAAHVKDAPRATPEDMARSARDKTDAPSQPRSAQLEALKRNQKAHLGELLETESKHGVYVTQWINGQMYSGTLYPVNNK